MKYAILALCLIGCVAFASGRSTPSCFLMQVNNNAFEDVAIVSSTTGRYIMRVDSASTMRAWVDMDDLTPDKQHLGVTIVPTHRPGYYNLPPFRVVCEGETIELNLGLGN